MPRTYFFARPEDLAAGVLSVERRRSLKYVPGGPHRGAPPEIYGTFAAIPNLGRVWVAERVHQPWFVVASPRTRLVRREIGQAEAPRGWLGQVRGWGRRFDPEYREYEVTLAGNPGAVGLQPGGLYTDETVLVGEVTLAELDRDGVELYRLVSRGLTGEFSQLHGHLYGPQALEQARPAGRFAWDLGPGDEPWGLDALVTAVGDPRSPPGERQPRLSFERTRELLLRLVWARSRTEAPAGVPHASLLARDTRTFRLVRGHLRGAPLHALTLPRARLEACDCELIRFNGTDLRASSFLRSEWLDCDFSAADLRESDLRLARFYGCRFVGTALAGADLRQASFIECDLLGAAMQGAVLTHEQGEELPLSPVQRAEIAWCTDPGPGPE